MDKSRFVIISQPRTGSNNIGYMLHAHPELDVGNELFHPDNGVMPEDVGVELEGAPLKIEGQDGFSLHWICGLSPDGMDAVFERIFENHNGFKIHTSHIDETTFAQIYGREDIKVIFTIRRNIFEQALSNFIAIQTRVWHTSQRDKEQQSEPEPFEVPPRQFVSWCAAMLEQRHLHKEMVRASGTDFFVCEFESFYEGSVEEKYEKLNRLYDFLGVCRIGKLPKAQRMKANTRILELMDPQRQRVTRPLSAETLVKNLPALRLAYARWVSQIIV